MRIMVNGAELAVFTVQQPHQQLRFFLDELPGLSSVTFQVDIAGQLSEVLTAPVTPPTIDVLDVYDIVGLAPADAAVDPCAIAAATAAAAGGSSTAGGADVVQIEGANFGGDAAFVNVTIVRRDATLAVQPCDVCHITHSVIRCVTSASRTARYDLGVTVAGQDSNAVIYSYTDIIRPPEVTSLAPNSGPTTGGTIVDIKGSFFKDRGVVEMRSPTGEVLTCETPPLGEEGSILGLYYKEDGTHIRCRVPPGVGTQWVFEITARRVFGRVRGEDFNFFRPAVTGVTPSQLPTTGGAVSITGTNFGAPLVNVTLDEYGAWNRSVTVAGKPCALSSWAQTAITCVTGTGVLAAPSVVVSVQGQTNAAATGFLTFTPPQLTQAVTPGRSPTSGAASVQFFGTNFGTTADASLVVYFEHPAAGTRYPCVVGSHTHTSGVCTTTVGAGAGLAVTVDTGEQTNSPTNAAAFPYSYAAPTLTSFESVDGTGAFPVAGAFQLRLVGTSFSTAPTVTLSGVACDVVASSHSEIVCTAPSNYGRAHELVVHAAGQRSPPLAFDFDDPVVTAVAPSIANAHDGSALDIIGYNFGLQAPAGDVQPLRIMVSGEPCEPILFLRDTNVRCDATAPRQLVGDHNVTVTTWRTPGGSSGGSGNATSAEDRLLQTSRPFLMRLECPATMFGSDGEFCSTCPGAASCIGGGAEPVANQGFYKVGRTQFLACDPAVACVGGGFDVNGTELPQELQCAVGYEGVPCDMCAKGFYRLDELCVGCPSMAWVFILLFVVVLTICLIFGVWLNKRRINLAALGIGVDFAQVVAMFVSLDFSWPKQVCVRGCAVFCVVPFFLSFFLSFCLSLHLCVCS